MYNLGKNQYRFEMNVRLADDTFSVDLQTIFTVIYVL